MNLINKGSIKENNNKNFLFLIYNLLLNSLQQFLWFCENFNLLL